ncbi:GNAT family N-acetyltransferase [Primorskyibacter aestuariivivens]|uniref:GNAT family N-acetyltransferase n=1 Tax=Primorskyibacter aestuariivivens TaxID=1888912 RepID=UPI002301F81F|nr:GNAT family N-acetyltransferase [Primorskyibacter aestuariivivens]MDA7429924.1 GNAT family N-acetyltransferase [Primorskyibacter aestuariivivens]
MTPAPTLLYEACEATWPPAHRFEHGPFLLRDGAGGGKRVSAATLRDGALWDTGALAAAEAEMRAREQAPLFMIRDGEEAFDAGLDAAGYSVIDPVNMYVIDPAQLTDRPIPRVTTFTIWEPLAIMRDIWAEGGIGPARIDVMHRVRGPKTGILGRIDDQPAATAFVAMHEGIAMLHALEVRERHRRKGLADWVMRAAAVWAAEQGAAHLAVLCVKENTAANGLYNSLGFAPAGTYHYRIRKD